MGEEKSLRSIIKDKLSRRAERGERHLFWAIFASLLLFVIAIVSIIFITYPGLFLQGYRTPSEVSASVNITFIVVCGVVGMVAALAIISVVLNALGLSNPKEALGLPSGSVRAMIALSLVVIFAVMSFYLYGQLEPTPMRTNTTVILTWTNTTQGFTNTTSTVINYNWIKPNEEQVKFSQQLLTTIGTLVTAVSAFYFGTQSVEVARGVTPSLKLNPSGETTISRGETLTITTETTPKDEKIIWEVSGDEEDTLRQVKPDTFKYTPGKNPEKTVTLNFTLAKYNVSEKLTVYIKVDEAKKKVDEAKMKAEEEEKEAEEEEKEVKNDE